MSGDRPATAGIAAPEQPFTAGDWGLLAGAALIWGSSFFLIEIGLRTLEPALVATFRLLFGVAALLLVPGARRRIDPAAWPATAVLGLTWTGVPFLLYPLAQQTVDSAVAGMVNGAVPIATAVVGVLVSRRLPGRRALAGLALGFLGIVAISLPTLQGTSATVGGLAMLLGAVVLYGIALNLAAPLQRRYGALPVLLRAELVGLAVVTPFGLAGVPSSSFPLTTMLAMLALGALGTALAFVALTVLVGRVGPARASVTIYCTPLVAIVLGVVVLGEPLFALQVLGTVLVLGGAWLAGRGG